MQTARHAAGACRGQHLRLLHRCRPHVRYARVLHAARTQQTIPAAPGLKPDPWTGTPQQVQALAQLQRRFPPDQPGRPDDATLLWYLRDRYYDVAEAEQKLRSMLTWRANFQPEAITQADVQRELDTGKAYVHTSPDVYGRPAVVIRVARHVTGDFPPDDSRRLCVYMLDRAIAALPPHQEQLVGIFDLRGFTLENADFEFARFMVQAFFEYYPKRCGEVLFVDAPWVFRPAWEVIKPLMRKYAALVSFVSAADVRSRYFTRDTVPADFAADARR